MYDDYYDDSMRLDEMMTADDYNRFEERELAQDRMQEIDNDILDAENEIRRRYGINAYCEWCDDKGYESVGEYLAATWDGDLLVCPVCNHEWVAIPNN